MSDKTETPTSHVRVGAAPRMKGEPGSGKGKGLFWSVPTDENVEAHVLVDVEEIISNDQCALWEFLNPSPVWTFIGDDDPSHDLGVKPGYRAFLPIAVKINGETQIKLWSMSVSCHRLICDTAEAVGGIKGHVIRIKRTGAKKMTKYSVIPTGKKIKVTEKVPTQEEIFELLGPYTRDAIIALIEEKSGMTFADVVRKTRGGSSDEATAKTKKLGKKAVIEEITLDDDEIEDLESAGEDEEDIPF